MAKERNARDQGLRTQAQVFSKQEGHQIFFRRSLKKRSSQIFRKVSGVFERNFMIQKIVLSLAEDRAIFEDL